MREAIFRRLAADRFEPTDLACGPWSRDALRGGPTVALMAGAADVGPSTLSLLADGRR